jgi:hypothetical protein
MTLVMVANAKFNVGMLSEGAVTCPSLLQNLSGMLCLLPAIALFTRRRT